jgi:hypothetical protein
LRCEATKRIETLENRVQNLRESRNLAVGQLKIVEDKFSERLDAASSRLEAVAKVMGYVIWF